MDEGGGVAVGTSSLGARGGSRRGDGAAREDVEGSRAGKGEAARAGVAVGGRGGHRRVRRGLIILDWHP